jgi:Flp pilus assembly CpaE family ATPase
MSQTDHPIAVLIGSDAKVAQQLRLDLSRRALAVRYELANARRALERLPVDQLERAVFFVEIRSSADMADLERLSNAFPGCPIAAILNYSHDDKAVVDAMRAGAAQVVPHPLERDDLCSAINRLLIQFGHHHSDVRTVAVCAVHGGVGATTLTLNIAHEIATTKELELRCLIAESTRSAGTITSYLGLNPTYTTRDLMETGERLDLDLLKHSLIEIRAKLFLMAAPPEGQPRVATDEEYRLFLRLIPQLFDVAVVDIAYVNDETILHRIANCHHCVLVASQSVSSLQALKTVRDVFAGKFQKMKPMLVINAFNPMDEELSVEVMEKALGSAVHTVRADADAVKRSMVAGEFLQDLVPNSVVSQDIRALARTVLNLPLEPTKQGGLFDFLGRWFGR